MKKVVLTFGLIAGAIMPVRMNGSVLLASKIGSGHSLIPGYTILMASLLLICFGIRSYRDNTLGRHPPPQSRCPTCRRSRGYEHTSQRPGRKPSFSSSSPNTCYGQTFPIGGIAWLQLPALAECFCEQTIQKLSINGMSGISVL